MLYLLPLIAYTIIFPSLGAIPTTRAMSLADYEDMAFAAVSKVLKPQRPDVAQEQNNTAWNIVVRIINHFSTPSIMRRSSLAKDIHEMIDHYAVLALKNIAEQYHRGVKPCIIRILITDLSTCLWYAMRWPGAMIPQKQLTKIVIHFYTAGQSEVLPNSSALPSLPTSYADFFRVPALAKEYRKKSTQ